MTRCEHLRPVPFLAECRNRVDLTLLPIDAAIAKSKMPTIRVDELAGGFRIVKLGVFRVGFPNLT